MRFADCVPILLHDPTRQVIGLVHAGWQGTVSRVEETAAQALEAQYASRPEDIRAAIGPSIAVHHYPVGMEVAAQVQAAFGPDAGQLLSQTEQSGVQFDLWRANQLVLNQARVRQVESAGICTACHLDEWYSHRGEGGKTGRFGALIAL
jgi:YfiH family protein